MRPFVLLVARAALLLPAVAGCASQQTLACRAGGDTPSTLQARHTPNQVLELASAAAIATGYSLAEFKSPRACLGTVSGPSTWRVVFEGRRPRPGSDMLVLVSDDSGEVTVLEGE